MSNIMFSMLCVLLRFHIEKSLEKGYLVLPDDLNYFDFAESTGKMNKPVILFSAENKLGLR